MRRAQVRLRPFGFAEFGTRFGTRRRLRSGVEHDASPPGCGSRSLRPRWSAADLRRSYPSGRGCAACVRKRPAQRPAKKGRREPAAIEPRDIERPLYLTASITGLRQGEPLGVRWRDADSVAKRIRLVSPFVRGEFGDPKAAGAGAVSADGRARRPGNRRATALREQRRLRLLPSAVRGAARPLEAGTSVQGRHRPRRYGRSSTGWAIQTPRRHRSTPTTSEASTRWIS
jgi:integrase